MFHIPFAWPFVIVYLFSSQKEKINKDIDAFYSIQKNGSLDNYLVGFYNEFITYAEFRSLFYFRIGPWIKLISWIYPRQTHLTIDVPAHRFEGGAFIQHGYCTDISARAIGEGFFVNQKVTIGWNKDGCPSIGKNCRIGTGAIVLGNIVIGDNVRIGANAIVVHDVPSNSTVCSSESIIVKRNGNRVRERLSDMETTE